MVQVGIVGKGVANGERDSKGEVEHGRSLRVVDDSDEFGVYVTDWWRALGLVRMLESCGKTVSHRSKVR